MPSPASCTRCHTQPSFTGRGPCSRQDSPAASHHALHCDRASRFSRSAPRSSTQVALRPPPPPASAGHNTREGVCHVKAGGGTDHEWCIAPKDGESLRHPFFMSSGFATGRASCILYVATLRLKSEWMPQSITIFWRHHQGGAARAGGACQIKGLPGPSLLAWPTVCS